MYQHFLKTKVDLITLIKGLFFTCVWSMEGRFKISEYIHKKILDFGLIFSVMKNIIVIYSYGKNLG